MRNLAIFSKCMQHMEHIKIIWIDNLDLLHLLNVLLNFTNFCSLFLFKCEFFYWADKVYHKGLLFKLEQMGISWNLLIWLGSYLSRRSQKVVIINVKSNQVYHCLCTPGFHIRTFALSGVCKWPWDNPLLICRWYLPFGGNQP